jgi:hypothetical protein
VQFERLRVMHDRLAATHPRWKGRIEVQYLSTRALRTFKTEKSQMAAISPGEPFHLKDAGREYLINWYLVRERGKVLWGEDPQRYIPPITKQEYLQATREHAEMWLEWAEQPHDQLGQSYVILTMCRALYAVEYGEQPSKKQAALWVQRQYPGWAHLIQKALAWRKGEQGEEADWSAAFAETARFVRLAADQVLGA